MLAYLVEQGHLAAAPELPDLPSRQAGTRATTRKPRAQALPPEQIERALAELPERSRDGYPVRALALFPWDTAMRPSMAHRLLVGTHWRPGQAFVEVTAENDKTGTTRRVCLSPRALALLTEHAPATGPAATPATRSSGLRAAGWPEHEAASFPIYDLRASRATDWVDRVGELSGAGHQLGHRSLASTALCV